MFRSLGIQTVFWTGLFAGGAALIAWRLHGTRTDIEHAALGAGGGIFVFCLLIGTVIAGAYTFARHGKVIVLLALAAVAVFFGGRYVGAW